VILFISHKLTMIGLFCKDSMQLLEVTCFKMYHIRSQGGGVFKMVCYCKHGLKFERKD